MISITKQKHSAEITIPLTGAELPSMIISLLVKKFPTFYGT
jgi:hypothetical protein